MPYSVSPKKVASIELFSKTYEKFRGVDFSTDPTQVQDYRSPYALNLISDMAGFPEKRVGWRVLHTFTGARINGIHYAVFASGERCFVHAKNNLYLYDDGAATVVCSTLNDARSASFVHGGKMYLLDGVKYRVITEASTTVDGITTHTYTCADVADAGFIPTTVIGASPSGGGTPFEAVNLLSPHRINSMIGNGLSHLFKLDSDSIDAIAYIKVNGVAYTAATTSWLRGTEEGTAVSFIPDAAPASGTNVLLNVSGKTYICVDESDVAIPITSITGGTRASFLLTSARDADDEYYLAKPFTYDAGVAPALPNSPTLTASLTDNTYTLTSTEYVADLTGGTIDLAAPAPDGAGVDNTIIKFSKSIDGYADRINKCTMFAQYGFNNDNRLFFAGNPDFKNTDWQSGLDDPSYFPDTGYTKIGADTSAIMGYLKQYDSLTVVKQDNEQDAEIFLRTAEMQADGSVIFPVKQGIKGVGAISRYAFATLRDDPLFLAKEGVFAIASTSVQLERTVQDRSYFVNKILTSENNLSEAVAAVWNGWYVLCVNGKCYVADSRNRSSRTGTGSSYSESSSYTQYGYEWYYWTNIPARVMQEHDGLFFGDESGNLCRFNDDIHTMTRFNDNGEAIMARWSTKMDDFGTIVRRKTLTKKGCGVMIKPYARSSIIIYTATDRAHETQIQSGTMDILDFGDIDFSRITFNTLDAPQVIPLNKKIKKFIVLQLIFENAVKDEGFGVYGAQVQYAIGGYVK